MKIEKIEWLDHCNFRESSWRKFTEVSQLRPLKMTTVGFVLKETKKKLIVVSSITEDNAGCGEMLIVKSCVLKRTVL